MNIGARIKELRLKKGLTQEQLASETEVTSRTIQRIENCEVEPRTYTLKQIAKVLEVEYELFFEDPGNDDRTVVRKDELFWIVITHASGLFNLVFPTVIVWLFRKRTSKNLMEHVFTSLNFQLSLLIYAGLILSPALFIPSVIFANIIPGLYIILAFNFIMVLVNTLKALNGQDHYYPLSITILKTYDQNSI